MTCDAFVARITPPRTDTAGPLGGLTLAVKDNFDVAGMITGAGTPEWAAAQAPAAADAAAVGTLMQAGATLLGKTQMDELAYSLMGANARHGTPPNPAAPDRVPGGSSSGSASAVAQGLADIGLGSDTGGSVRLPASFCGLIGWRPTHGLLPVDGMLGLAPSYDTVGLLTRDIATMRAAAAAFGIAPAAAPDTLRAPADLWALAAPAVQQAFAAHTAGLDASPLFTEAERALVLPTFRTHQAFEIWRLLGDWVSATAPDFGPGIRERFAMARAVTPEAFARAQADRASLAEATAAALPLGTALLVPTAPGPAPLLTTSGPAMDDYRNAALSILAVAGNAGLPQVSLPLGTVEGAPVGLSLVGPRGTDAALLTLAERMLS